MLSNKKAFTLIELLVVVLIIGILAAVALPQYQKTVERSKATQAMQMLSSIAQAYQIAYLANGEYAQKFEELDVDIPFTGNTKFYPLDSDTKSNEDWSFQIEQHATENGNVILFAARISGKYKGAGFAVLFGPSSPSPIRGKLLCFERTSSASILFDNKLQAGSYCEGVMQGTYLREDAFTRLYQLP